MVDYAGYEHVCVANDRGEPRPEAGAQRTLEGVGSSAGLGSVR